MDNDKKRQDRIAAFVYMLKSWWVGPNDERDELIGAFLDTLVFKDDAPARDANGNRLDASRPTHVVNPVRPLTACNCEGGGERHKPTGIVSKKLFDAVLVKFCTDLGIPSNEGQLDVMVNDISRVIKKMRAVAEAAERLVAVEDEARRALTEVLK